MSFGEILAQCMEKWRGTGITLLPPSDDDEIREIWGRLGHRVSEDILLLYTTVGGFDEGQWDRDEFYWSLWSVPRLRQENLGCPTGGVQFCDHSIQVITWELRFEDERRSSVWQVEDEARSAPSLELFFQTYLEDPWQLLRSS
jgi:hypothetical protein